MKFKEQKETHCKGVISIENIPKSCLIKGDLGIQIAKDGRVWVCIDGIAFLRFNPNIGTYIQDLYKGKEVV